jgi:hypothetical protein
MAASTRRIGGIELTPVLRSFLSFVGPVGRMSFLCRRRGPKRGGTQRQER